MKKAFIKKMRQLQGIIWLNWCAAAGTILVSPFVFQALIEYIRIQNFAFFTEYIWIHRTSMFPAYLMLAAVGAMLVFATARPWIANLTLGVGLVAIGAANLFKLQYRGDPLFPKDFVQISEAALISKEIGISFTKEMWLSLLAVAISTLLLLPFKLPLAGKRRRTLALRITVPVLCCAFVPLFIFGYFGNKELMQKNHGVQMVPLSFADSYYRGTFGSSFLYLLANSWQEEPQGYNRDAMNELAGQVEQSENAQSPDIIIVLLESFFDVQQIEGTSYSEPLLTNYERLSKEGVSGLVLSDKRDGGTSDFEYQVLTGYATAFMSTGSVPMIEYTDEGMESLPSYLSDNGYSTLALHTYIRSFYNRPLAYQSMKIEEYYAEEVFDSGLELGNYISDDALATRIIEEYEARAQTEEPIFIHAVTMQNHMPYMAGVYPEGYAVQAVSGFGEEYDGVLSTYATGVRDEDAMIGRLCDYFRQSERNVILLFFGDHQSSIAPDGQQDLATLTEAYLQADAAEQWKMTHTTPFLIWANYEQEPADGGLIAPYMLVPTLARYHNVNLPLYFNWLALQLPYGGGVSGAYYILPDGSITAEPTPELEAIYADDKMFQYDLLFGKRYAYES